MNPVALWLLSNFQGAVVEFKPFAVLLRMLVPSIVLTQMHGHKRIRHTTGLNPEN
jgi:hypothetical protein